VKVAVYQFEPQRGDKAVNLKKIADTISGYSNVNLWILPELATTGYLFDSLEALRSRAEQVPEGDTCEFVRSITRKLNCAVILGLAEKQGNNVFNSAVVYDNGNYLGSYRKIHLFDREKRLFTSGTQEPPVFIINDARIGVMICFDWFFPETARTLALKGAQIIAHPANLVLPYCPEAMMTRSIENRVFTVTANRTGVERLDDGTALTFTGSSQIIDPMGKRLGRLSATEQGVLVVEIDPAAADNKWITENNHVLRDRRVDLYNL
jgi:predicted amidohydrolase